MNESTFVLPGAGGNMSGLIVHEWVETHGGAENVVDAMLAAFPDAELMCLWNDAPKRLSGVGVSESWLSRTPLRRHKALALPFMSGIWRSTDLTGKDWALVSSHLFAHHIAAGRGATAAPIYVYAHTPARYIWEPSLDGRGLHPAARLAAGYYRRLDRRAAASGAVFAANSHFVRKRIERTWGQSAEVIYPPVNVEQLQSTPDWRQKLTGNDADTFAALPDDFILGASRFVPYKNLPAVIDVGEACNTPVVLAGGGPQQEELKRRAQEASVPVHIVEQPSDVLLYSLYQSAALFVFPPVEDFGIMPVEAMALGTPVLVNPLGGAAESVGMLNGGALLPAKPGVIELREAVDRALSIDMVAAASAAAILSKTAFMKRLTSWMDGSI